MSNGGAKVPVDEDVPVRPCRLSNSVLIWAAMSFSMLYFSSLERGGGDVDHLLTQVDVRGDRCQRARTVGVLGERARLGARGCVDLVRDKLVLETRLGVYEGKLWAGRGAPVVLGVLDRRRSARHGEMNWSGCGASAVSRRKGETVLDAEDQPQ